MRKIKEGVEREIIRSTWYFEVGELVNFKKEGIIILIIKLRLFYRKFEKCSYLLNNRLRVILVR